LGCKLLMWGHACRLRLHPQPCPPSPERLHQLRTAACGNEEGFAALLQWGRTQNTRPACSASSAEARLFLHTRLAGRWC
jgi:hypothetical protein